MRERSTYAIVTLLAYLLFDPTPATAGTSMAVLGVEAIGVEPGMASRFSVALKQRIQQTGRFVLVRSKDLAEVKLVFGCVDEKPDCMASVGKSLRVAKMLWGTLKRESTGVTLTVRMLDVAGSRVEKFLSEPVSDAELRQAETVVARLTASMFVGAGTLKLACSVPGAQVLLDGELRGSIEGSTLLLRDVRPGRHRLQVRGIGYQAWERELTVASDELIAVEVDLKPLAISLPQAPVEPPVDTGPEDSDPVSSWRIAFWTGTAVTMGFAVGLIVHGVGILNLEDDKAAEIDRLTREDGVKLGSALVQSLTDPETNVCDLPAGHPTKDFGALPEMCQDGIDRAAVQNGLIIGTAVAGTITAFLLYKAYFSTPDAGDAKSTAAPGWHVVGGAAPTGAELGVRLRW